MLKDEGKISAGIKQIVLSSIMLSIQVTIFLVSSDWKSNRRVWIFFWASFLHFFFSILFQYRFNPELLVIRLKIKREGSKFWDEILMRVSNLMVLISIPVVAGLDVGRFHLSNLDIGYLGVGLIMLVVSSFLLNWAMLTNPFFEPTVRIQRDRGHKVITGGPYRLVRHPGYLSGILFAFSIPLIMGSFFTLIPAVVYALLMMVRTFLEDRTLLRELDGYYDYAEKVKYRLLPLLW